jgi:hypothetical protein
MTKQIAAFRNFANTPEMSSLIIYTRIYCNNYIFYVKHLKKCFVGLLDLKALYVYFLIFYTVVLRLYVIYVCMYVYMYVFMYARMKILGHVHTSRKFKRCEDTSKLKFRYLSLSPLRS